MGIFMRFSIFQDENAATIEIVFAIGLKLASIETKCRGTFVLK